MPRAILYSNVYLSANDDKPIRYLIQYDIYKILRYLHNGDFKLTNKAEHMKYRTKKTRIKHLPRRTGFVTVSKGTK